MHDPDLLARSLLNRPTFVVITDRIKEILPQLLSSLTTVAERRDIMSDSAAANMADFVLKLKFVGSDGE